MGIQNQKLCGRDKAAHYYGSVCEPDRGVKGRKKRAISAASLAENSLLSYENGDA